MRLAIFGGLILVAGCASDAVNRPASPPLAAERGAAVRVEREAAQSAPGRAYPPAKTVDVVERRFGIDVRDPYRWLEDARSPDVQRWVDAEEKLARARLDALPDRAALAERLRALSFHDVRRAPVVRGRRLFFEARTASQEKNVLHWRGADGADHVLLDPNAWPKADNPSLQSWTVSHDGAKVAYAVSLHNGDASTLHVIDVATGAESARDTIPRTYFAEESWAADGKSFVYRYVPPGVDSVERNAHVELRRHRLGEDPARDVMLHEATGNATRAMSPGATRDGHWLFAAIEHGDDATEIEFRDARRGDGDPRAWTTLLRAEHVRALVQEHRDRFYLATNDGAPNWRIVAVDPAHPERARWKEIVAERADARLQDFAILGGRLVLDYTKAGVSRLEVHALDGALEHVVALPDFVTVELPSGEPDAPDAYFELSSFTRPTEVVRLDLASGATSPWFRADVGFDPTRFETEQVLYPSKDGTRVPMFLVHAKGMRRDGSAMALLNGYGGFDLTYGPRFRADVAAWLERGGLFAWASLRGGGEYGEAWHRAGMLHAKQNVFDDFAAAAEWLTREGYTRSDRLVAMGRSNGGLLVGAATTQRPELFRAVICGAPVLDMIRYPLVGGGRNWVEEYGDPQREEDFRALFAYSPVHHVRSGVRYPAVLIASPIDDDRVDPMHARKFAAALQAASVGGPVLFRVEHDAGHFGVGSQSAKVDLYADELAFALAEVAGDGAAPRGESPPVTGR